MQKSLLLGVTPKIRFKKKKKTLLYVNILILYLFTHMALSSIGASYTFAVAAQKCRFWSVRATLSQSKITYFTNSFLFYHFLFLYFTLFSCVKFIAPFTGFQNNKYKLPKIQILRF